jgi:hypothetical protein
MEGAMFWLVAFDLAMITIALVGLLPWDVWAKLPPRELAAVTAAPRTKASSRAPQPV